MKQQEIMSLLQEATTLSEKKNPQRLNEIQRLLNDAVFKETANSPKFDYPGAELEMIVDALFVSIIRNQAQALPLLFPLFALLCGDRNSWDGMLAKINWTIYMQVIKNLK